MRKTKNGEEIQQIWSWIESNNNKSQGIELYGDMRAVTQAIPEIFGLHKKDPGSNSVEVLSYFMNKKMLPIMNSCMQLFPQNLKQMKICWTRKMRQKFSSHNIKLTPQSKVWTEEYRPGTKLQKSIKKGDIGGKQLA